tara:strand:+ start:363 stop:3344 length:2982 start_codon:yes stop_codon:yes gene_type:complete
MGDPAKLGTHYHEDGRPHQMGVNAPELNANADQEANAMISGSGPGTGQSKEPQFADFTGRYKGYGFLPDAEGNVKQWRSIEGQQLWEKNTGNVWGSNRPAPYGKPATIAPVAEANLGTLPYQSQAGRDVTPEELSDFTAEIDKRFEGFDLTEFNESWQKAKQINPSNATLTSDEEHRLNEFFENKVRGGGAWLRGWMGGGQAAGTLAPELGVGDDKFRREAYFRAALQKGADKEMLMSLDFFKDVVSVDEAGKASVPDYLEEDIEVETQKDTEILDSQSASDEIQRFVSEIEGSWSDEDRARTAIDVDKIGYTYTPPNYDAQGRVISQGRLHAGDNAAEISSEDRLRLAEALAKQADAQNIASQTRTMNIKSQAEMEQLEATQAWKTEERQSEQEFKSRQARLDRNFAQAELDQRERERRQQAEFQRDIQYRQMRAEEQANRIAEARNTNERLSIDNAKEMSENQLAMQTDMYQDEIASREGMQENEFEHQIEMQEQAHEYNMAAITEQAMQQRQTESQRIRKQGFQDRLLQGQRDAGAMDRLARQISADHISQGREITNQRAMQAAELSMRRALQHQELGAEMARLRQAGRQNIDQTRIAGYMERQNQAERIRADERAQGRQISSTEALARADRFMQQNLLERRLSAEMGQQLVAGQQQMGQIQETGIQERLTQMAGQQRAGRQELEQIREGGVQQRLTQQEGATQGIAAIQEQAEQERQTYQYQLQQQEASEQRQREALGMDTEQTIDAVRTSTQNYSTSMNAALKQAGETGDYESVNTALAAELPPAPPGLMWDSSSGSFQQRGGFQGREISAEAQQWMATAAPAFKARDRAEQAVTQAQKIQMEAQTRRRATEQAQQDFAEAMLTSNIDSAEEAAARHEMAKTSALATEQKMQHVQMLFNLLQNPVQLGMAKRHGLLGQIESALGFSMSGVPESAPGETNLANWQSMDSEDRAFAMADYIEQGGSPDEFMRMVASAAPAQMRQVQYGVL